MEKIKKGMKLEVCEDTENLCLEFKDYFRLKKLDGMIDYYQLIREPTAELENLILNYQEKRRIQCEIEHKRMKLFIHKTAQKLFDEMSLEERQKMYEDADPGEEHLGLGLYVRNKYIFAKLNEIDFPVQFPDTLSSEILSCLVSILVGFDYDDPFYSDVYASWRFPWLRKLYFALFDKYPDEILKKYAGRKNVKTAVKLAVGEVYESIVNKERFAVQAKKYGLSSAKIRSVQEFFKNNNGKYLAIPYDIFLLGCDLPEEERMRRLHLLKLLLERENNLIKEFPRWLFEKQDAVLVAVSVSGKFLRYFRRFNMDDSVIRAALQSRGDAIQYVSPLVRDRLDYIRLALVEPYGCALHMPCMRKYRDNDECVILAVTTNGRNIQFASTRLRDDFDIACLAVTNQNDYYPESTIKYLSKRLRDNKEIALLDMEKGHGCFDDYSKRLRNDLELAILNVKKGRGSIADYSPELRDNEKIAQAIIESGHTFNLHYMSDRIKALYREYVVD